MRSWGPIAEDKLWVLPTASQLSQRSGSEARIPDWLESGGTSRTALLRPGWGRRGGLDPLLRAMPPQPQPGWRPAAVALTSAGRAEQAAEPRAQEGGALEGPRLGPPVRTCPLAGVAEKSSSELQEAGVPRSAPEHTDRAQPGADPGPQREIPSKRRRRLLFAVRLCLGPGSTTGCRGVPGRLWSRAPTPSHWHLWPSRHRALREQRARACAQSRTAVSGARRQAPP